MGENLAGQQERSAAMTAVEYRPQSGSNRPDHQEGIVRTSNLFIGDDMVASGMNLRVRIGVAIDNLDRILYICHSQLRESVQKFGSTIDGGDRIYLDRGLPQVAVLLHEAFIRRPEQGHREQITMKLTQAQHEKTIKSYHGKLDELPRNWSEKQGTLACFYISIILALMQNRPVDVGIGPVGPSFKVAIDIQHTGLDFNFSKWLTNASRVFIDFRQFAPVHEGCDDMTGDRKDDTQVSGLIVAGEPVGGT